LLAHGLCRVFAGAPITNAASGAGKRFVNRIFFAPARPVERNFEHISL
jgi:hypothetical protein